jgi:hypothetical protein
MHHQLAPSTDNLIPFHNLYSSLAHGALTDGGGPIGLPLRGAELLGRLPEQRLDRSRGLRLTVKPFVYALTREPVLNTNHEVEKVVWLPLDGLQSGSRDTTVIHEYRGNRMSFPAWDLDGDKIWGLTYRMIQSLFDLLEGA